MTTLTLNPGARHELKIFGLLAAAFAAVYFLPVESPRLQGAIHEALALTQWYAREHVLLCLIPAFFIAGAIAVFVSQQSVMHYLGARRTASLLRRGERLGGRPGGCSCTVLPLFAGIYARGAGLGPATAFLYSGPAINVLAIIMTAKVLGLPLGIARAVGAVGFSVVIGALMASCSVRTSSNGRRPSRCRKSAAPDARPDGRVLRADGGAAGVPELERTAATARLWRAVYNAKWWISAALAVLLAFVVWRWFARDELLAGAVATMITAAVLPGHPTWHFSSPCSGSHGSPRGRRVGRVVVGLREADLPPAAGRRADRRLPARPPRPRGHPPLPMGETDRWRQLTRR